jgi:hypothetical protein
MLGSSEQHVIFILAFRLEQTVFGKCNPLPSLPLYTPYAVVTVLWNVK